MNVKIEIWCFFVSISQFKKLLGVQVLRTLLVPEWKPAEPPSQYLGPQNI